ncbi:MAG: dihydropyrimidinase [Clostridiales bacterium]|jgi:dihydropyrimidinase|nr:dihydropyrimidinase [Clostridiales bacterium]
MRTLIKNGDVVCAARQRRLDVLVEDAHIASVAPHIEAADATVIDAAGCLVFPGFIDTHTHFDLDFGNTVTADNFITGTRAALVGGTTTILDFATQNRGRTMGEALAAWHEKARGSSCNYGFHMAMSEWSEALYNEMPAMMGAGVTSFKMYMVYPHLFVDDGALYRAQKRAAQLSALIGVHCENYALLQALTQEQKVLGNPGPAAHPRSRPPIVEAEAVSRCLRVCELAGAAAYIVHLSTGEGLAEARRARLRGQTVLLETCPQYLLLVDACYDDPDGAKYVMSPPLRTKDDTQKLWQGLVDGDIQTVGTDHCSFTMEQKRLGLRDFTLIPNGAAGVETRPALYYTYGVKTGALPPCAMAAHLSENAARIFGMYPQKGAILPGSDADIVVWEPVYRNTISYRNLRHNCDNTPFEGFETAGRARDVLLGGVWAVQAGKLTREGCGRFVPRGIRQDV